MGRVLGMNSAVFGLVAAVVGAAALIAAWVAGAHHHVPVVAMGVGGALAMWAWGVAAGHVFIHFARQPEGKRIP